jgi:hypothetical protein
MPRLRQVRTKEEAEAVPEDQSISVVIAPDEPVVETSAEEHEKPEVKETKPEPESEIAEEAEQESLKTRLGELERAEQAAQQLAQARERDLLAARQQAQQYEAALAQSRSEAVQANYDIVSNALAAAQAESDAAQRDWEAAANEGDLKRQSEANIRINRAQARIVQYEDAKATLEARKGEKPPERQQQVQGDPFENAIARLPEPAKNWLRAHRDYVTEPEKNAALQHYHWVAKKETGEEFTQKYIDSMEVHLGMRSKEESATRSERTVVSAPVSREAPSLKDGRPVTTRITLTPDQRSAARMAGISEVEYAKQLIRMNEAKKNGLIQ